MATILAQKATTEKLVTTDDDHHDALASDPTIPAVTPGSTYTGSNPPVVATGSSTNGSTTATTGFSTGATAFGASSTGGFGGTSGFGSSTSASSGFGSTTSGMASPNGFGGGGFGSSSTSGFGGTNNMGSVGTSNMNMSMGNQPVLTGAGTNAANGAEVLVANTNEDWINKKWRPVMGWMYMVVCMMDFTVFPVMWSVLQALNHGQVTSQWQPLTLQGAGLFHIAMGAVLGIAAYGRTKEKVAGAN